MLQFAQAGEKRGMLTGILILLLALALCLPSTAFAEAAVGGEGDVGVANPLTPNEGEAAIVEHTQEGDGENHLQELLDPALQEEKDDLTFENDLPSYTKTVNENLVTGEKTEYYTLTARRLLCLLEHPLQTM